MNAIQRVIIAVSHDDDSIHKPQDVEDPSNFSFYEISPYFQLDHNHLYEGYGRVIEVLLRAGIATPITYTHGPV